MHLNALSRKGGGCPGEPTDGHLAALRRRNPIAAASNGLAPFNAVRGMPRLARRPDARLADVLAALNALDLVGARRPADLPEPLRTCDWYQRILATRIQFMTQYRGATRIVPTRHPKLAPLRQRLIMNDRLPIVSQACDRWVKDARRGYLDVAQPSVLDWWLSFLSEAGISPAQLALRVTQQPEASHVDQLSATVVMAIGCRIQIERVDARHGRPTCYLLLSSAAPTGVGVVGSAEAGMAGFHTLMLGAAITEELRRSSRGKS